MVLLMLADDAPTGRAEAIAAAIAALPSEIPSIRSVEVGVDMGIGQGTSSVGLTMTFDDEAGWRAYQNHPAHQVVIADLIRPVLASRAAVQIAI